jgi:dUTP pyrophosphatase
MKVKFKKLNPRAKSPEQAHEDDAGFDLFACSTNWSINEASGLYTEYGTGISFEIPKGYVGFLLPRSSISKTRHMLKNSVGVIDSGYRGEVKFRFSPDTTRTAYMTGDKIGQIVFIKLPKIELQESDDLSESSRNSGGFGSTGN